MIMDLKNTANRDVFTRIKGNTSQALVYTEKFHLALDDYHPILLGVAFVYPRAFTAERWLRVRSRREQGRPRKEGDQGSGGDRAKLSLSKVSGARSLPMCVDYREEVFWAIFRDGETINEIWFLRNVERWVFIFFKFIREPAVGMWFL